MGAPQSRPLPICFQSWCASLEKGADVRHSCIDNVTKSLEGEARRRDAVVSRTQTLEDVRAGKNEQFEDVPHLTSEFKGSFHALHGDHVGIACDVTKNEGDADRSKLFVGVPREGVVMPRALRKVNTLQCVDDDGGEHGQVVYGERVTYEGVVDDDTVRKTSTWYVIDFAPYPLGMSLAPVIVGEERAVVGVVWVVAPGLDDAFRVPVPKGVTVGAPHCRTTLGAK